MGREQVASLRVTRAGVAGTVLVLVVAAVCIRLGLWQLDRMAERRALNDAVAARMAAAPLVLRTVPRDTAGLIYRRVVVRGEVVADGSLVVAGRSHRGSPGVHVVTPIRVDGGAVLVNRGWVPSADAATIPEEVLDTSGVMEVTGLVLPFGTGRRSASGGDGVEVAGREELPFARRWFGYDPAMAEQYAFAVAPFYVQALPDGGAAGAEPGRAAAGAGVRYPVQLPPPELGAGPHLGYAIQWFSFALVALIGWGVMVARSGFLQVRDR